MTSLRFLGVGKGNDLADLYYRLAADGHDVRVYAGDPEADDIFRGMLTRCNEWERELPWVREAGAEGILIFEGVGWGETQDRLRAEGYNVIGGSALGDRLELDRAYGQQLLSEAGLSIAEHFEFENFNTAIEFVRERPGRYVLKYSGAGFASTRNYVGEMDRGEDIIAVLRQQRDRWTYDERPQFLLMEHLSGVEVGVGAFFNGTQFLQPANLDWEHKRFFPGNLGELTGEMGTLATYEGAEVLFQRTLKQLQPLLARSKYTGYINLNTIVNERGIFPLELTCRFGYPGFAILDALHRDGWAALFAQLIDGRNLELKIRTGYAVCVVLTVPTFPYVHGYEQLSKGAPILFRETLDAADRLQLHYAEVAMEDGQLVTSGSIGYVMVVTGNGPTVEAARDDAYQRCQKIVIPNVRYRRDIGELFLERDRATMQRLGYFPGN